ncbi:ninjurin-1-like [Crassostrea virginica]
MSIEKQTSINIISNGLQNNKEDCEAPGDEVDFRCLNKKDESNGQVTNHFTDKQNFVRQLCDASLLAANVSQLRSVLENSSNDKYFIPLLVMISLAIFFHVVFGILLIQRWKKEKAAMLSHKNDPLGLVCNCEPCATVERYDEISIFIVFFVVILNVGIAGLGL